MHLLHVFFHPILHPSETDTSRSHVHVFRVAPVVLASIDSLIVIFHLIQYSLRLRFLTFTIQYCMRNAVKPIVPYFKVWCFWSVLRPSDIRKFSQLTYHYFRNFPILFAFLTFPFVYIIINILLTGMEMVSIWNRRMIVQIRPRMRRSFRSRISSAPMFSNCKIVNFIINALSALQEMVMDTILNLIPLIL